MDPFNSRWMPLALFLAAMVLPTSSGYAFQVEFSGWAPNQSQPFTDSIRTALLDTPIPVTSTTSFSSPSPSETVTITQPSEDYFVQTHDDRVFRLRHRDLNPDKFFANIAEPDPCLTRTWHLANRKDCWDHTDLFSTPNSVSTPMARQPP